VLLLAAVAVAQGLRHVPSVQRFIAAHPGTVQPPHSAPKGFPAWVGWQHFFNLFLLIFIMRSGLQILADQGAKIGVRAGGELRADGDATVVCGVGVCCDDVAGRLVDREVDDHRGVDRTSGCDGSSC
jgi:hypothetical protein